MNYQETLEYLFERLPMYQREGKSAYKKDLTNTIELLEALDNPHKKFKSVHIAGTNGKGTCAHGIAAIMQLSGYKTGLYTSPHLKRFTERIRINGEEIGEDQIVDFVSRIKSEIERIKPSFFEITVAMAFDYFAKVGVDIAVIETGLGGRLDSTNVVTPEACLITNIGFDHMDMLGDTLEEIAYEKAGIIKQGVPVVIGKYQEDTFPVFIKKAKEKSTRLFLNQNFGWTVFPPNYPYYKSLNYDSIKMLVSVLREYGWEISEKEIGKGIDQMESLTGLKGRFQKMSDHPLVIADVSHNEDGLRILFNYVNSIVEDRSSQLHLIYGTVKDKELEPIFKLFPKEATIFWTQSSVPRSLSVEELAIQGISKNMQGECYKHVNEAIQAAKEKANPRDLIVITGSTFVVAEIDEL